jgi:hypothetical protein
MRPLVAFGARAPNLLRRPNGRGQRPRLQEAPESDALA